MLHIGLYWFFLHKLSSGDLALAEIRVFNPIKPYDFLFMGDSHCQKGIDTSIIKKSAKWTGGGENNIIRYYKIKHLINRSSKPFKYLLLSSDLTTYTSSTANYMRNYFYYNRLVDFEEWGQIRGNKWATLANAYKYKLFPYIEIRDIYLRTTENLIVKRQKRQDYSITQKTLQQNQQQATDFVENSMLPPNPNACLFDTTALVYLKKTLDLCAQHQIKVFFIQYPLSKYLVAAFEKRAGAVQIAQSPVRLLIEQYPNARILNYEQIFDQQDQYFADCQHLNPAGARAFSAILQHDLQSINNF